MKKFFGFVGLFALLVVTSCTPDKGEEATYTGGVSLHSASSQSATVAWENGTDAGTFTVKLYRDAACTDEFQSYSVRMSSPYRFTFTYLAPSTSYYAVVTGSDGLSSAPCLLTTKRANSYFERKVLYHNFDALCWGGDYVNNANSVILTVSPTSLSSIDLLEDAIEYSKATLKPNDEGPKLMLCPKKIKELFGLDGWSSNNVYVRPGYIKIGSATSTTEDYIKSPALDNIPDNAGVNISFKALAFASEESSEASVIKVCRVDSANKVLEEKLVYCGETTVWGDKSVQFSKMSAVESVKIAVAAGTQVCIDDLLVQATVDMPNDGVYGFVLDKDGAPIEGVAVSDGFSVVATDADGFYLLKPSSDAWYIYISIPADCKMGVNSYGRPDYYQTYNPSQKRYDFTLEKLEGGAEKKFVLMCLGDPQVSSQTTTDRFYYETRKFIRTHAKTLNEEGMPCYAITLGDNVSSGNTSDRSEWMDEMRNHMSFSKIGLPVFQVMGNHDHKGGVEVATSERSSTLELAAQRTFENIFGPANFSFNRGDVHIIGMRDIIYNFEKNGAGQYSQYAKGFTDAQYEWLKQDLALVPKDKMVILCVHIPLYSATGTNVANAFKLLDEYAEAHVMSGHTHDMRNTTVSGFPDIEEHVLGATCGCWWNSTLCKDGAPNGYGVFYADGATFTNWYYQGVNDGMNDKGYQMRLFRGGMLAGGQYEYVRSQYPNSTLLANVFNSDKYWKLQVYASGQLLGEMEAIPYYQGNPYPGLETYDSYVAEHGAPSKSNPTTLKSNASNDWYTNGYHAGVRKKRNYYSPSYNMFKFENLTDEQMKNVEVVATDRFGNVYRSSNVIEGVIGEDFDYKYIIAPTH